MRAVFSSLSEQMQNAYELVLKVALTEILDSDPIAASCSPEDIEDLKEKTHLIPPGAKLPRDLRPTLELVRSLSFVAEIGYDPAEARESVRVE
jgi:hypothetical protein